MKIFLAFLVTISVTNLVADELTSSLRDPDNEFQNFKKNHKKNYKDAAEESKRKEHFKKNLAAIQACNAASGGSSCAVNEFADWSEEELNARNGRKPSAAGMRSDSEQNIEIDRQLPASLDWRNDACLAAIKNQGKCGGCWSFAATAPLEFRTCKAKFNTRVILSEQNLIDCSTSNYGCNGGLEYYGWDYVKSNGGINSNSSYPYKAVTGTCAYKSSAVAATVKSRTNINGETAMMNALQSGPIAAGVYASTSQFQFYSGTSVFDLSSCPSDINSLDHSVVIAGYGTANGVKYWILRNSWGTGWGNQGYMLIRRGVNLCGIEADASYPNV